MRIPIEMQQLGPDLESCVIIQWHRAIGDPVKEGDLLLEVETEKVDVEVASLDSGTLVEIVASEGEEVAIGSVIGYLEVPDP